MSATSKSTELAKKPETDISVLVRRAQKGDESVVPILRKAMEESPWLVEFAGNLATAVQDKIISDAAGRNFFFKEGVLSKMDQLRTELAGDNSNALERLLVDRILLCWLALHLTELRRAGAKDVTWKQDQYWERHFDSCQKRYLSAIKALATIRKLALPAVQVNIARKQVNVLNTASEGEVKP